MANREREGMKSQRWQALILVLIALALGSLLITPTLWYTSAGVAEVRISEEQLLRQYAADAAVEYSLWQLQYSIAGLTEQLNSENTSSSTSITLNGMEAVVTTAISQTPQTDSGTFPVLPSESGIHLAAALEIISPGWSPSGETAYIPHLVYLYNYGTAQVHLKSFFQQLNPGLTYEAGSYEGPAADVTTTYVNDHWEVSFDFREPLPRLGAQEQMVLSFMASATEDMGVYTYSGSGWVSYAAFQEEEKVGYSGQSGPVTFGLYDISVTIGQYNLLVSVGITEAGEIVIRSYQIL